MYSKDVVLKNKERYAEEFKLSEEKLRKAYENAVKNTEKMMERFSDKLPEAVNGWNKEHTFGYSNNRYAACDRVTWANCLWTGMLWLLYMHTGDEKYRSVAESQLAIYYETVEKRIKLHNHDTGFKFTSSCVAAYRITGNEKAKKAALMAAEILYEHYCPINKFIIRIGTRSKEDGYDDYRTLVDSMMNIPLLFWAYEQTGDKKFYDAAVGHYNTTAKYLVREDGSSYHHYQFDPETLKAVGGCTFQGYSDESCWSRGHSWLLYGFPVAYKYTGDNETIDIHKAVSYYFMDNLPCDFVPYWDFAFTDGSFAPRDSSASAIAACGLLEMCKYLPDDAEQKPLFLNAAHRMIDALIDTCENTNEKFDGLIHHVTGSKPHNMSIDSIALYGDYFYLEALIRLVNPDLKMFW